MKNLMSKNIQEDCNKKNELNNTLKTYDSGVSIFCEYVERKNGSYLKPIEYVFRSVE